MDDDRIEREIRISASVERVWEVLTEPAHVGVWFGTGAPTDIDLRPGGIMVLDHGEHGRYPTTIVRVDAPHAFSYWWAAAYPDALADEHNSTLVEFTLESVEDGTLLRVVESGFARLTIPADREESASFERHVQGWPTVVAGIGQLATGGELSPLARAG